MLQLGFLNPWLHTIGSQGLIETTVGGAIECIGIDGQTGWAVNRWSVIPYASWNAMEG